jgi:hypothetical protein
MGGPDARWSGAPAAGRLRNARRPGFCTDASVGPRDPPVPRTEGRRRSHLAAEKRARLHRRRRALPVFRRAVLMARGARHLGFGRLATKLPLRLRVSETAISIRYAICTRVLLVTDPTRVDLTGGTGTAPKQVAPPCSPQLALEDDAEVPAVALRFGADRRPGNIRSASVRKVHAHSLPDRSSTLSPPSFFPPSAPIQT